MEPIVSHYSTDQQVACQEKQSGNKGSKDGCKLSNSE